MTVRLTTDPLLETQLVGKRKNKKEKENNNINSNMDSTKPEFKGILDPVTKGLHMCDKYPILGVSFIDTVSTNVPRTVVDLKTAGVPAALETARREFSGLIIDCLIPGFIVLGGAKLLEKPFFSKFGNLKMSNSWANQETVEKLASIYEGSNAFPNLYMNYLGKKDPKDVFKYSLDEEVKVKSIAGTLKADDIASARESLRPKVDIEVKNYVSSVLSNLEGYEDNRWKSFSEFIWDPKANKDKMKNFSEAVDLLTNAILDDKMSKKDTKKAISKAYNILVDQTKVSETIRFLGDDKPFNSNLSNLLRDTVDLGRKFKQDKVYQNLNDFTKKTSKFINVKSLLGMGIVLPLAMSAQAINRAITRHKYKQKGAPIYKDFEKGETHKELEGKEKKKFFLEKIMASAVMIGLGALSMNKKPSLNTLQFNGLYPTMDQCRIISVATFVSRFFASEDRNELRESLVRDAASFAGLYFLGDYAAKACASLIEKINPKVSLLNRFKTSKADDSIMKKFGNWLNNTKVKSFEEVKGSGSKNLRALCQVANIGFSIITLGVLLPIYNRKMTEKKLAKEKQQEAKALQEKLLNQEQQNVRNTLPVEEKEEIKKANI